MAQNPLIKRYLDAGMAFTQMTQARAEAIVKELVKAGEVQAQRTEELVTALVERSRQNTDKLLETVRKEVRDQIAALGVATKDDVARVESKVSDAPGPKAATKKQAGSKKASAKKSPAKKSTKKKSAAKKSAAKKSSAKKSAAKKSTAKKSSKKAGAKKAPGSASSS